MRKLIVTNVISLDGYFEGPGGNVMALPLNEDFSKYNAERLRTADTLLVGRSTYEGLKTYWPPIADDAGADPVEREISRMNNAVEKVVISDGLTADQTAPWQDTTEIVKRSAAHERVAELKNTQGRDILTFGSHRMWNDLLAAGLVDELHLLIGPGLLGAGTPVFEAGSPVPLHLLEARPLDGGQLILTRYTQAK